MTKYKRAMVVACLLALAPLMILELSGKFLNRQRQFMPSDLLSGIYAPNVSAAEIKKWQTFAFVRRKQGVVETQTRWKTFNNAYRLSGTSKTQDAFIEVKAGGVYLFSAVGLNLTADKYWDFFAVNAWELRNLIGQKYTCCLMFQDYTRQQNVMRKISFKPTLGKNKLTPQGRQYLCKNPFRDKSTMVPKGISIVGVKEKCPSELRFYLKPVYPVMPAPNSFAVCAKVVFGNMDANSLVEWIEYQRYFGVTKVIVYLSYETVESAKRVLEYYSKEQFVEVIPIGKLPRLEQKRDWGTKDNFENVAQDTAVILFDFQSRCHSYTFGGVIDPDEFVLPKDGSKTFVKFMNGVLRKEGFSRMAQIRLTPEFHIKDWSVTNSSIPMMLTQYGYHSPPVTISYKHFFIFSRVVHGTIATHRVQSKATYISVQVDPKTAVLRHYRKCENKFKDDDYMKCVEGKHRIQDHEITRIASAIYPKVQETWKALGIDLTKSNFTKREDLK